MAIRLEQAIGSSAEARLCRQAARDLARVRQQDTITVKRLEAPG